MQREAESKEIMERFLRLVQKTNALEKLPRRHGEQLELFHSERHMLDQVGENPGINVSEFASLAGVTKGAISQVIKKLEHKGLVRRYKNSDNEKEVFIELTDKGEMVFEERKRVNQKTIQQISKELSRGTDSEVLFLLEMFRWFEQFLDRSRKTMNQRAEE